MKIVKNNNNTIIKKNNGDDKNKIQTHNKKE